MQRDPRPNLGICDITIQWPGGPVKNLERSMPLWDRNALKRSASPADRSLQTEVCIRNQFFRTLESQWLNLHTLFGKWHVTVDRYLIDNQILVFYIYYLCDVGKDA